MRPPLSAAAALLAAALGASSSRWACICAAAPAFVPPPVSSSISTSIIPRTSSSTIGAAARVRARPLASSPDGRYDHFRSSNDSRIQENEEAYAAADRYISEHLASLPSLRQHSGDAQIQRNVEAVRRGIAYYLAREGGGQLRLPGQQNEVTESSYDGSYDAPASALGVGANDASQQPSAAGAAAGALSQQAPAMTEYLDGLSSGRLISTPSSAEAAGAIRSYLDSLPTAMENEVSASNGGSGGGTSFGQSSYLQYIDEACDADDPMSAWASIDTNNSGTSASSGTPDETASVPSGATTITVGSTTHVGNIEGLRQNLPRGEDGGVIARSYHEEGDTKTETTVSREGDDTVLIVTSTTRIVMPREG